MVTVGLQVRQAILADQQQIAHLMFFEPRVHRHLDWRAPLDWLGSPHYWVLGDEGRALAALACPQDPPGIAWIRLFVSSSIISETEAWQLLWTTARSHIFAAERPIVAAIAMQPWFESLLLENGFVKQQVILMFEWNAAPHTPRPLPRGVRIRRMSPTDLPAVAALDWAAFTPLWRNSFDALQKAHSQAILATVAETDEGLLGYQISTGNPLGAHLARLAVRPDSQGLGIGTALVEDLIQHTKRRGKSRITLNTQGDNQTSQNLYEKIGFIRTGEQYPVLTVDHDDA
ncbi:MAG: GNAT family N-acetyltransferase [Chloroflexi bacterium]|nr:GNAT family N-acetyltransferase [Chloroflexota bacterium]